MIAAEAIQTEAHNNPQEYVQSMEPIAELEYLVGIELEGQVPSLLLDEYQEVVNKLIAVIEELVNADISITWEDAVAVAEIQLKVCEIVAQMLE